MTKDRMENHPLKLAIIGASYLQEPLIQKAKSRGIETHVFAWAAGDVGERSADFFYPISIVEKDVILEKCREIGIDGICSIASDLAAITVNHVAWQLGLPCNPPEATLRSTNKHAMRLAFEAAGCPSPKSLLAEKPEDLAGAALRYPVIVKPLDRSGSRGITKLTDPAGLPAAIGHAIAQGFDKRALVEEFAVGREYSVEYISFGGKHRFLAMTQKYTTGAPGFVETAHLEPAPVEQETLESVKTAVTRALDALGLVCGASHSELKIAPDGSICFIEIGGRMGGDCIGSDLVELSTGYDFVDAVIDVALGREPRAEEDRRRAAAVRFVFSEEDLRVLDRLKAERPSLLVREDIRPITAAAVSDSSARFGYFLMAAESAEELLPYLPEMKE